MRDNTWSVKISFHLAHTPSHLHTHTLRPEHRVISWENEAKSNTAMSERCYRISRLAVGQMFKSLGLLVCTNQMCHLKCIRVALFSTVCLRYLSSWPCFLFFGFSPMWIFKSLPRVAHWILLEWTNLINLPQTMPLLRSRELPFSRFCKNFDHDADNLWRRTDVQVQHGYSFQPMHLWAPSSFVRKHWKW